MSKLPLSAIPCAALALLVGCATIPTGPSVMVLPGRGRTFGEFQYDDATCRDWCAQQFGGPERHAATDSTITGAAVGTAIGAASGAAIGAAAGEPGIGAAVGSGVGLLTGTAVGAEHGQYSEWELQRRYDIAYVQCMYAKGHQVPVPRGYEGSARYDVPPPPAGNPPPPPAPPSSVY